MVREMRDRERDGEVERGERKKNEGCLLRMNYAYA